MNKAYLVFPIFLALFVGVQASYSQVESQDITIQNNDLPYSLEPLTQSQLEECENIYEDYTTLGESVFNQRYLYHKSVGNCVMLYEDPIWETEGDDRYEKLSDRLATLVTMREAERIQDKSQAMFLDITSITELQIEGTYLVLFNGCTGHDYLSLDDIVVASDTETVSAAPPGAEGRILSPGKCGTAEIQIRADDPDSISVVVPSMSIEKVMAMGGFEIMSPRHQMMEGTALNEVVCKEGLELMKKTSDRTAACVKSTSVDRLVERGWGTLA